MSSYLAKQESDTEKRRNCIAVMRKSNDPRVAFDATTEINNVEALLNAIKAIRSSANLPVPTKKFPDMAARCKELGPTWEFLYHATYRDLCEAVHGSFFKVPFAPSLAFKSANKGEALIYEHCRVFNYAVDFWAVVILDCCQNRTDKQTYNSFRDTFARLNQKESIISDKMRSICQNHQITF